MNLSTYEKVVKSAEEFLVSTNSYSQENAKSTKEIVSHIRSKIDDGSISIEVSEGTILSYISKSANADEGDGIVSGGPKRGYWYQKKDTSESIEPVVEKEVIKPDKGAAVTILEKDLYPLMELWLQQKGYKSKDTSNLKSGGRWGNPDIVGVERVDLFGAVEIDLGSCEVKIGESNWEQVIFEAISHKRFANRSWFCYRVTEEHRLPKGMEYYAERYKVGVVQIVLTDDELIALKRGLQKPLDLIDNVIEKVPALYDQVPLRQQRELIERSGIQLTVSF